MGYLPGYLGCYPYYGTVVYGTGYHYRSWRSRHHYYPRRFTWGFHARYNPWLVRWSFGFSYNSGFFRVGSRWLSDHQVARGGSRPKWFGPGGYRRPLVAADLTLLRERPSGRTRARLADGLPANMYNRSENIARVNKTVSQKPVPTIARAIARPAPVADDVFAGRDGQVYRRDPKGKWQVRKGNEWKPTKLPSPPPAATPSEHRERASRPSKTPSQPEAMRPRREPAIERAVPERAVPERGHPRERVTPPSERPVPPSERPAPPRERPTPPSERPTPPRERPAPPPERPTPGDLEREYRARERSERRDDSDAQPPVARPTPPPEERDRKAQDPPQEKPERSRENSKGKGDR